MSYSSIILNSDSYKTSHFKQYPPGTQYVSSYIEARGIDKSWPVSETNETVLMGLQMFEPVLTARVTKEDVDEAESYIVPHGLPFNREGWMQIVRKFDGHLPLEIKALPEGTVAPLRTAQVQVVNTDPEMFWLTSYIETALLRAIWYPSTVATLSRETKKIIYKILQETSDDPDGQISFKLHDFGGRGATTEEAAKVGGLAHLVNFMGTDTMSALVAARRVYGAQMAAFSVPAAEHSTITAWGEDFEVEAYANMLKQFGGEGKLVSVVSDSYDIYNACDWLWGQVLKEAVLESKGVLVVRPDSGDPMVVTSKVIEILGQRFGYTVNGKGYKVLNPAVRIIQGDGVNPTSIKAILENYKRLGWSADNIVFGMGGALLQKVNRDSLKYAMKANAIYINGSWKDVYKRPSTDPVKDSKAGRLAVVNEDGLKTIRLDELNGRKDELVTVFKDGEWKKSWTLDEIRERARL